MKYIVTGATSGLGRNLAERLSKEGHHVIGLGRQLHVGQALTKAGIEFHALDLKDTETMSQIMRGADTVFHCAALSSPWGRYEDFYKANVVGTKNIITAMKESQTPFLVHISTPSLYFNYKNQNNIVENDPLPRKFANHYATTKKMAEDLVINACHEQKIRSTIIRPRAVIGPYDKNILPRLLHLSKRGFIPLINGGNALVDITYVDNVVDAILLTLKTGPHQHGRIYNITNGEPVILKDLISMTFEELGIQIPFRSVPYSIANAIACAMEVICKALPSRPEPPLTRYSAGVFGFSQTLNIDKAKNDLGYIPQIPIKEGIRRSAQWWRKNADRI
ncbi:MAG: NAD(P)-dependent oxidoreductase [Alphaproteobacteria bacterium]|nr:NAD(P)-dependent oxidoreductase [Alphaproteobacteria bacterium]